MTRLHYGYADTPGTGPQGHTCGDCRHRRTDWSCIDNQKHPRCGLIDDYWERVTDIRLQSPACRRWAAREARA